jgi:hypothetical protein
MLVNEANEYYGRLTLFSKVNRVAVNFHNANPSLKTMAAIDVERRAGSKFLSVYSNSLVPV